MTTTRTTRTRRAAPREVQLPPTLTVKHLADLLRVSPIDVIKQLMRNGVMAAINQVIDFDLAATVTPAFGYRAKPEERAKTPVTDVLEAFRDDDADTKPRSPVVTILGHVDHGKTTLLDTIRDSRITEGEVGGITQHIGAYQVEYNSEKITFLDTPGHEAFTAIRARGAQVTDIAILVVAADDGVMPQTVEAIDHARAAELPIIVAINKIDLPNARPDRVKSQLLEYSLVLEDFGGEVIGVPVSAKNRMGIDDLLESILVVAEISELKANPGSPASGVVIESQLDRNRGPVATLLIQSGTLKVGNSIVAGTAWGRIRAMENDLRRRIKQAGPAVPVEVQGFRSVPQAGDRFVVAPNPKTAKALVQENVVKGEEEQNLSRALTLEDVMSRISAGDAKELSLIIKADAHGSVEAVRGALQRLDTPSARVNILHSSAGGVNESDVLLASASDAIILAFNVGTEPSAEPAAEREAVEIRTYDIIYQMIEDVEKALKGILEPAYRDVVQGMATVRAVFRAGRVGRAAGVIVNDGRLTRGIAARVIRNGNVVAESSVSSLRRFKDDVNEVSSGFECGIGIAGFEDFQEGDVIETHRRERSRA